MTSNNNTNNASDDNKNWNNPIPVGVALLPVLADGQIKLLGVVRAIPPKIGEIALPAGYTDDMEDSRTCMSRELWEETGVVLDRNNFRLLDTFITPNNRLLVAGVSKVIVNVADIDLSFSNAEVFNLELIDRDTPIAFPLHKQMIDNFFNELVFEYEAQLKHSSLKP